MIVESTKGAFVGRRNGELMRIEAWGENALRVRTTRYAQFSSNDWALMAVPNGPQAKVERVRGYAPNVHVDFMEQDDDCWLISNGRMSIEVNHAGVLSFFRDGTLLFREHFRNYDGTISRESRCLKVEGRAYKAHVGGDFRIVQKFESIPGEKIFGMGQYQQEQCNLKGCVLELEQRNSQVSVPFMVSSAGYGFLWNNPAIGRVTFGANVTEWIAECSKELDYWICAGEDPRDILRLYTQVTGRAPAFPDKLLGLWQCKLRYRTQEEVLQVARECVRREVPIDVIVIDFFHWTRQGDWQFDSLYWPDPKAMVDELHSLGIKVCVSVWPSVDKKSIHFNEMWSVACLSVPSAVPRRPMSIRAIAWRLTAPIPRRAPIYGTS